VDPFDWTYDAPGPELPPEPAPVEAPEILPVHRAYDAPAPPPVPQDPFLRELDAQMDHAQQIYREAMEIADTAPPESAPDQDDSDPSDPYHGTNSLLQGDIASRTIMNSVNESITALQTRNETHRLIQESDQAIIDSQSTRDA
jgi:hypothetical protein